MPSRYERRGIGGPGEIHHNLARRGNPVVTLVTDLPESRRAAGRSFSVFIAHDLDADNTPLLRQGLISAVLHHDLRQDLRQACLTLLYGPGGPLPAPSAIQIITPHNAPPARCDLSVVCRSPRVSARLATVPAAVAPSVVTRSRRYVLLENTMFVIFDLEYTAWAGAQERGWTGPGEFREIVQIGALRVDSDTLLVDGEFDVLVKPRHNPRVSGYFEELTGIANDDIEERGVDFLVALNRFVKFCDGAYALSYGNDMVIIGENIILQVPPDSRPDLPLPPFVNIRQYLHATIPETRGLVAGMLGRGIGAQPPGDEPPIHDALLDCGSILEALRHLRRQGLPLFALT